MSGRDRIEPSKAMGINTIRNDNIKRKVMPHGGDILHGITLAKILETLVQRIGWKRMGEQVNIKCFTHEPTVTSSLRFLRRTPWAREKVEQLYIETTMK